MLQTTSWLLASIAAEAALYAEDCLPFRAAWCKRREAGHLPASSFPAMVANNTCADYERVGDTALWLILVCCQGIGSGVTAHHHNRMQRWHLGPCGLSQQRAGPAMRAQSAAPPGKLPIPFSCLACSDPGGCCWRLELLAAADSYGSALERAKTAGPAPPRKRDGDYLLDSREQPMIGATGLGVCWALCSLMGAGVCAGGGLLHHGVASPTGCGDGEGRWQHG